jgi:hypothetical protein
MNRHVATPSPQDPSAGEAYAQATREVTPEMQRLVDEFHVRAHACTDRDSGDAECQAAYAALLSAIARLERDAARLDWLEREAGRRLWVRDESDSDICNVYFRDNADPLRGGVFSGLRDVADYGLKLDAALLTSGEDTK